MLFPYVCGVNTASGSAIEFSVLSSPFVRHSETALARICRCENSANFHLFFGRALC
jgi:hypothetical protein